MHGQATPEISQTKMALHYARAWIYIHRMRMRKVVGRLNVPNAIHCDLVCESAHTLDSTALILREIVALNQTCFLNEPLLYTSIICMAASRLEPALRHYA